MDVPDLVNYPEVVALAGLLASDDWRVIASADRRRDRLRFELEAARQLDIARTDDALGKWPPAEMS